MRSTEGMVNQPVPVGKKLPESVTERVGGRPAVGPHALARPPPAARRSPRPAAARPAPRSGCARRAGTATLTSTPTAAPMSVSTTRLSAAASAPAVNPTPSTSIALIGTSMRLGPSRSSWPTTMAAATRMPRLHQVRPTTKAKPVAIATPASTASTRSHAAEQGARRRRLHDEQRGQCRDQRGRVRPGPVPRRPGRPRRRRRPGARPGRRRSASAGGCAGPPSRAGPAPCVRPSATSPRAASFRVGSVPAVRDGPGTDRARVSAAAGSWWCTTSPLDCF